MKSMTEHYIGPEEIKAKRASYFYPCTQHFYQKPPQIVKGSMQHLYDDQGQEYIDFFAGVSVVACGHCNPSITDATLNQIQRLQHTTTIYLTQPIVDLAERLAELLPGTLQRTFFVNSGTEANEGALLLARMHTGRKGFIALEQGLHGRSNLTMSVTGLSMWRTDPFLEEEVYFIPRPYRTGVTPEEAAQDSLKALDKVLEEKGDTIAALIIEPIQGNGGIIVPPDGYLQEVKARLERYGVLMIADEIQTGFGRTGRMFAIEHFDVVPDIISMAKALGNGVPIGAFSTTDHIAASLNRPSASTFGGNPVSSVTGMAVLDYIGEERLVERSEELGHILMQGLEQLMKRHGAVISEVRGKGLMIGVELLASNPDLGAILTDQVLEEMKEQGFLIGKNGIYRNVLAFQPPLVIQDEDIQKMLKALDIVLERVEASKAAGVGRNPR
ncbi:aspartate aminotransferase family protein [Paenibacillus glacialis]|uniref:alanine--glyoxylate transaminase n=1 Tax=Paenibacillus glacialis TaxID=494026 RepID=A0A168N5F3_9BACL|nr:aspartate aminotransferase family protein [Paenibacillus glacialis]OAB45411.1 aminotransferase class III [Paenibacillus glacialis]